MAAGRRVADVALQLDYYMSSQFAGVAMAIHRGLYQRAGIKLRILPTCVPGDEAKVVSQGFRESQGSSLFLGCMEQNTLLPAISQGHSVKAVAAMFGHSPLCLTGLPGANLRSRVRSQGTGLRIGVHSDTEDLVRRILPRAEVTGLDRRKKLHLLKDGEVDAVQAYDVMETLKLAHDMGVAPEILKLEDGPFPGVALGYSQAIFAPTPALRNDVHRQTVEDFLRATFDGWSEAIDDPSKAAKVVHDMQGHNDHWVNSLNFVERSVRVCCDYVRSTQRGGELGTIDPLRWGRASDWLAGNSAEASLDASLWKVDGPRADVLAVTESVRSKAMRLAHEARAKHGHRPKLTLVNFGHKSQESMAYRAARLRINVEEVVLPPTATTRDVVGELRRQRDSDGIQLLGPLPAGVDEARVRDALPVEQDVDVFPDKLRSDVCAAIHGKSTAKCEGAVAVLERMGMMNDIELFTDTHTVILSRNPKVSFPLAQILHSRGATVTLTGAASKQGAALCAEAEVVVSDSPLPSDWKQPAIALDFGADSADPRMASAVEELCHAIILRRTARNAVDRHAKPAGADELTVPLTRAQVLGRLGEIPGWALSSRPDCPMVLRRDFWTPSYIDAVDLINDVMREAETVNHHPNFQITHHCRAGATVTAELHTHSITAVSEFDMDFARRINKLVLEDALKVDADCAPEVHMSNFEYDLPDALIAQYPAEQRDRSRFLVALPQQGGGYVADHVRAATGMPGDGPLDLTFSDLPALLPADAHLVCNESKVFSARLFATGIPGREEPVEVMFLSPESDMEFTAEQLSKPCTGQAWRCMVRSAIDEPGTTLTAQPQRGSEAVVTMQIEALHSRWCEEGEDDGVEATVRLRSSTPLTAQEVFDAFGKVPLPPYMHREPEESDRESYQNVYAGDDVCGSVAAPTAGLHFTPEVLSALEGKGISFSKVALHVGAGTFRPVTSGTIAEHRMHTEGFEVGVAALEDIASSLEAGRPTVPVGTTAVRTLESLYWLGVIAGLGGHSRSLGQWEAYGLTERFGSALPAPATALRSLCDRAKRKGEDVVHGSTSLCIVPGYTFKLCDALVTNFHQPDSTLLLLVAALAGRDVWHRSYAHAVANGYRFLSYGDSSLFFNAKAAESSREVVVETPVKVGQAGSAGSSAGAVAAAAPQPAEWATPAASAAGDSVAGTAALSEAAPADGARKTKRPEKGEKVLLHSCCAPCSGAMIEEMHSQGLDVTIFFYNPNIHPKKEYEIRKQENVRYAEALGIPIVDCDYDVEEWYRRAQGMEFCPERGQRCSMCFDMRFERTALYAYEHGFPWITTTNATSRWKDPNQVNASGLTAAAKYDGVTYWIYDWQTQGMTDRKYQINADHKFYKQEYCGCSYSLRDSNAYRKKEGMPPIKIGQGSTYSDPEADSAEESVEVVESFFEDAKKQEELRRVYQGRRKGQAGASGQENW